MGGPGSDAGMKGFLTWAGHANGMTRTTRQETLFQIKTIHPDISQLKPSSYFSI